MNTFGFLFHQFSLNLRYMKIQQAFLKLTGQDRNYFILAGTLLFGERNAIYNWPWNNVEIQEDNLCAVENPHTTFEYPEKLCCPLVSTWIRFQNPPQIPKLGDAQVPYIKWDTSMHTTLCIHRLPTRNWKRSKNLFKKSTYKLAQADKIHIVQVNSVYVCVCGVYLGISHCPIISISTF